MHRRAAKTLADLYADDLEPHLTELAHHLLAAAPGRDAATAIDLARQAGDRASRLLAREEAAPTLRARASARRLDPGADGGLEWDCSSRSAKRSGRGRGDAVAARDAFLRAASLARRSATPRDSPRAALGYGGQIVWARAGSDPIVVRLLKEAIAAVG